MTTTPENLRGAAFIEAAHTERATHAGRGWPIEHDRERGPEHPLRLALDYLANGKPVEAGSLILAGLDLLGPDDHTRYQHELVLNALDRLANQAIETAGATVLVPKDSAHIKAVRDAAAGDAELVRTALAAAPVAPSPVLTDETIERGARALAGLEPGEDWPTNEKLGGGPTGTRDDEYRDSMREQASAVLAAARVAPVTPSEPEWEHGTAEGDVLLARVMDALAYLHCKSMNPKADSPHMGYHAMSEDQREFLRERQREAADGVLRMWRAEVAPAPSPDREKLIAEARSMIFINDSIIKELANALEASSRPIATWQEIRNTIESWDDELPPDHVDNLADRLFALAVPPVANEAPTPLTIAHAQKSGKTSALVDAVLAKANERGIAVTIVPPVIDEAVLAEAVGVLSEVINFHAGTNSTHYEGCYRSHAIDLAVMLRDVLDEGWR